MGIAVHKQTKKRLGAVHEPDGHLTDLSPVGSLS